MKKLMYLLIGAASLVIYKALVESRSEEGVLPRKMPRSFDRGSSVEDEVAGPLTEV